MKKALRAIRRGRKGICAGVILTSLFFLIGFTGSCEINVITIEEYAIKGAICLAVMIIAAIIGADRN